MGGKARKAGVTLCTVVVLALGGASLGIGSPGRIVFSGESRGVLCLVTIRDDGSARKPLTTYYPERVSEDGAQPYSFSDLCPAWSPDGSRVAFARRAARKERVWGLWEHQVVRRIEAHTRPVEIELQPGSSLLAVPRQYGLGVGRDDERVEIEVPDGFSLVGVVREPERVEVDTTEEWGWRTLTRGWETIYVADPATQAEEPLFTCALPSQCRCPTWSPDGNSLAYGIYEGGEWRIAVADLRAPATDPPTGQWVGFDPDWSPTAARVAFSTAEGICVTDPTAAVALPLVTSDGPVAYRHARWSPDGRRLAFYRLTAVAVDLVVLDLPSGDQIVLASALPLHEVNGPPCWSPDGAEIAVPAGRGVRILRVAGGAERVLDTGRYTPYSLDWTK